MELHERIRELRKKHLKLSQTEFGNRLGVSRSVIKNIELNALARPDQKLSLIKLMCKEFNVSEEWLLNGIEPMYIQTSKFNLDDFIKSKGATELELEIVKAYFELDPNIRKATIDHFKNKLSTAFISDKIEENIDYVSEAPQTPEELEELFPPVNMEDISNIG